MRGTKAPSRWRALILSVAVPIVLFGGATAVAEVVSPARGQSLLPVLPQHLPSLVARRVLGRGLFVAGHGGSERGSRDLLEGGPNRDAGSVRDHHRQPCRRPSDSGSALFA